MKTSQEPFPFLLKLIQSVNYVGVVILITMAVLYAVLPSNNELVQMQGIEPKNKYIVSALSLVGALFTAYLIYLIRNRKAATIPWYVALTFAELLFFEIHFYFASYTMTMGERVFDYFSTFAFMFYIVRSKKVARVLNK